MRKDTVLIVLADDDIENNKIRVNKVVRKNLRIRLGTIFLIQRSFILVIYTFHIFTHFITSLLIFS